MKKVLVVFLLLLLYYSHADAALPKVWDLTLNKTSLTLYVGQSETLVPSYMTTLSSVSFTWKSSNTSVATVDNNGMVTAKSAGTTKVTCSYSDGETTVSTECAVEVRAYVTSITLNKSSVSIQVGETTTVTATVSPYNAYNKTLSWSSSNSYVAAVDNNGTITGKHVGNATVTARATDGSNCSASLSVEVKPVLVTDVSLNITARTIGVGESFSITATVYPSNATDKSLTWKSSDTNVAYVDNYGTVTARSAGSATITATANDGSGCSDCCQVTVNPTLVTSLTVSPSNLSLQIDDTYRLIATAYPYDANNKTVTWTSSKSYVATVDDNGLVTAVSAGNAVITAMTTDGSNIKATCNVEVQPLRIYSLALDKTQIDLYIQGSNTPQADLYSIIYPQNATNQFLNWESSDVSVASVWVNIAHTNATIWGRRNGTSIITAKTTDGSNLTAKCTVTVRTLASDVSLNKETMEIPVGSVNYLIATVSPNTTSNKNVAWKSSEPSIASVSSDGTVTAISVGNAVITATTTDGTNKSASCSVIVKAEDYSGEFIQNGFKFKVLGAGACKLTSIAQMMTGAVTIPSSVTYNGRVLKVVEIESFASHYSLDEGLSQGVTSIIIPNTVTKIDNGAFCIHLDNLRSITIPSSVTYIGDDAFAYMTSLQEVHISDIAAWCNISFGSHNATSDASCFFVWRSNPLVYAHKLYINGTKINRLIIPEGVEEVNNACFWGLDATEIVLPNSLTQIGSVAFRECCNLNEITIPNQVARINQGAFDMCENLKKVVIGKGIKVIESGAFYGCTSLTDVHITDLKAWSELNLYSPVVHYRSGNYTGTYTSANGNPATFAQKFYYNGSEVINLVIPEGTSYIGAHVFAGCKHIKTVTIPSSVTDILEYAFSDCSSLEKVYAGTGLKYIGWEDNPHYSQNGNGKVFKNCKFLEEFHIKCKTPPSICHAFEECPIQYCTLYVPSGAKNNYENYSAWSSFGQIVEEESSVDNLCDDATHVVVKDGIIMLTGNGNQPVEVVDLAGRIIYSGHATSLPIRYPGIYIVRINGQSYKVKL